MYKYEYKQSPAYCSKSLHAPTLHAARSSKPSDILTKQVCAKTLIAKLYCRLKITYSIGVIPPTPYSRKLREYLKNVNGSSNYSVPALWPLRRDEGQRLVFQNLLQKYPKTDVMTNIETSEEPSQIGLSFTEINERS